MCKRFFCILLTVLTLIICASPALISSAELFPAGDVELSAQSALVINLNTGLEVFSKNADEVVFPASTTKILTAIMAIEACDDLQETVEVSASAMQYVDFYSSKAGLEVGEKVSVYNLLGMLMVKSGCDAACVLAEYVAGNVDDFVRMMNAKAQELGCSDKTNFLNCDGMHLAEHYTTARDIAKITMYALKNETFLEFWRMKQITIDETNLTPKKRLYTTTNFLIDANRGGNYFYRYATGGKTGSTTPAGKCLVSTAQKGDAEYLCLVFGAEGDTSKNINKAFSDSATLYNWCFQNLSSAKIAVRDAVVFETGLRYAWNHDFVTLSVKDDVTVILPNGLPTDVSLDDTEHTKQGIVMNVALQEFDDDGNPLPIADDQWSNTLPVLEAPVVKDDVVAKVKYSYRDADGTVDIVTGDLVIYESVDRNFFSFIFQKLEDFFSSKAFLITLLVLIVIIVAYIIIRVTMRSRGRRSSKYRKRRYRGYRRY